MQRTLYTPGSITGGPTLLKPRLRSPNTVFVQNNDAVGDAYFSHDRAELMMPNFQGGINGHKVAKGTKDQFLNWEGDLWAVGSVEGVNVQIQVVTK